MKKEIIEFTVVFSNGFSRVYNCQTLLEAFCMATKSAIDDGRDTSIHHILYQRECALRPKMIHE